MVEHLAISAIGQRGDGIAQTPEGAVYVPYALPDEIVEVDAWPGHPDRRHLVKVERASKERIDPICPHFGVCGGCALQHWDFARYRVWKRDLVLEHLSQTGISAPVGDLLDAHGEGRRRAVLHASRSSAGVLSVGFAALHAHTIVPIDRCPVLVPGLSGVIATAWSIAEALASAARPLDIQATATRMGMDVDVRGSGPLTSGMTVALAAIAETHGLARITRHGELVAQRAVPSVVMGTATVLLPPGAFLQATALGEETLTRLVCEHARGAKFVADLFAGVGPFGLRLAQRSRVLASDSDENAMAALRQAADGTPGLKPIEVRRRDLFRRPFVAQELPGVDAVVFDPPRQGAEAQARELARGRIPLVLAVSCNAGTFARDAGILTAGGYRLTSVTPVDQFRYSPHVEIVGRFEK